MLRPTGPAKRISRLDGQRVFVLWRSYGNRSATERQKVVAHELVHVALVNRTSGRRRLALRGHRDVRLRATSAPATRARCSAARRASDSLQAEARPRRRVARPALKRRRRSTACPRSRSPSPTRTRRRRRTRSRPSTAARRCCASSRRTTARRSKGPGRKLADRVVRQDAEEVAEDARGEVDAYARRTRGSDASRHAAARRSTAATSSLLGRYARAARSRDDPPPPGAPRRRAGAGGRGDPRRALVPAARAGRAARRACTAARWSGSSRRGKYLVWELSDDVFLLMHLRMTGTLLLDPDPPPRHARVRFALGDHELVFDDPRRFGTGELALGPEALAAFFDARLGVEPLERDVHRRAPVRARAHLARAGQGVPARSEARRRRRATSTPTRRCSAPACTRCGRRTGSPARSARRCATPSSSR